MGERNIFAIALSFSLVWHLVGGKAVYIVWPQQIPARKFAEINFWGSLLDANNLAEGQIAVVSNKDKSADIEFNVLEKETFPVSELFKKNDSVIINNSAISEELEISESIQGELKRSVLVKPALPVYPEWAKELGNYFEIELKFLIMPDGTVGTVDKLTSAGYTELYEIGIRYIRKWKFMPLPQGAKPLEQWGTIKLVFNPK